MIETVSLNSAITTMHPAESTTETLFADASVIADEVDLVSTISRVVTIYNPLGLEENI